LTQINHYESVPPMLCPFCATEVPEGFTVCRGCGATYLSREQQWEENAGKIFALGCLMTPVALALLGGWAWFFYSIYEQSYHPDYSDWNDPHALPPHLLPTLEFAFLVICSLPFVFWFLAWLFSKKSDGVWVRRR
jgi:hypothetical protein